MMKKALKTLLLATALFQVLAPETNAQSQGWKMRPVEITTRWAKDVKPDQPLNEYPRPQMERSKWKNLNGLWDYATSPFDSKFPGKFQGKILVPFPIESALSGVKKKQSPFELLWYKRNITRPLTRPGERVLLHFGAVDFEATVYINGKEAGKHAGGYQNFSIDATVLLKSGQNELTLKVWDPTENGPNPKGKQSLTSTTIWYTPTSGIWQTVWMEVVPENFIKGLKITPDVDKGVVNLVVNSNSNSKAEVSVRVPGCSQCGILKQVQNDDRINITLKVPNAKLWSPDDPFLYDLEVSLGKDKVKSYFGMRKVEVKQDENGIERIFLNGKYTYNLGVLDQGFWPEGLYTAPTDEALAFDVKAAKAMGFNTIRKHIKIEPARWYYHCDKLGMLVWQDMVHKEKSTEQFERENAENMAQLHNHPCITTWVLFNENWGAYDQERLTKWMKGYDPSRLVNGHSGAAIVNGKVDEKKAREIIKKSINSDMTDVHSYPPPAIPNSVPGKVRVLGEFGGIGVTVDGHIWDDLAMGWGYGKTVSSLVMNTQYASMTDSLVKFERQGLSASIYTQPYDVESEQNGFMTYDRNVIKLPLAGLREINRKLWPATKGYDGFEKELNFKLADTSTLNYKTALALYTSGQRDLSFLRKLALTANAENDKANMKRIATDYILGIKDPFTERDLRFIKMFTTSIKDPGFEILLENTRKVEDILGKDAAESLISGIVERELIAPRLKGETDWTAISKDLTEKYGELGTEIASQTEVNNLLAKKKWDMLAKKLPLWYNLYGKHRTWVGASDLNDISWALFEGTSNKDLLNFGLILSKKSVDLEPGVHHRIDTYANLLHKVGRTKEAIEWEKKALELDPGMQEYKDALEKMEAGAKTWKE